MYPRGAMDEERYRALLDPNGVLRGGAFDPPDRAQAYAVFAQRSDARLDASTLIRHAARFFETDLGLTVDKKYDADGLPPEVDVANVVLSPREGGGGVRLAYARPVTDEDHAAAEQADLRAGYTGLYAL